jgi:hypothetical protein
MALQVTIEHKTTTHNFFVTEKGREDLPLLFVVNFHPEKKKAAIHRMATFEETTLTGFPMVQILETPMEAEDISITRAEFILKEFFDKNPNFKYPL